MSVRGFGMHFDFEKGTMRQWYVDDEGVKRWSDDDSEYKECGPEENATNANIYSE